MLAAKREQQSWRININAKSNKFHFKFKATKSFSSLKFPKFSLFLLLHLNTESQIKPLIHSKFLNFLCKFKLRRSIPWSAGKISVLQWRHLRNSKNEETNELGGSLAALSRSITEKDAKGIVVHGLSSVLFLLSLCFNKCVNGKITKTVLLIIILLSIVSASIFLLDKFINYRKLSYYYVFQLFCKAWNYVAFSSSYICDFSKYL